MVTRLNWRAGGLAVDSSMLAWDRRWGHKGMEALLSQHQGELMVDEWILSNRKQLGSRREQHVIRPDKPLPSSQGLGTYGPPLLGPLFTLVGRYSCSAPTWAAYCLHTPESL